MIKIIIIGAGKIGSTICQFLSGFNSPDFNADISSDLNFGFTLDLTLADNNSDCLLSSMTNENCRTLLLDENCNFDKLFKLNQFDAVINAGPYSLSIPIAEAALTQGLSYFDLTEDVQSCKKIQQLAKSCNDGQIFAPQCGLAPGFISILARSLYDQFEQLESVQLRVGALPQFPTNQMLYNLTWSTAGLVNEYCNKCQVIEQGEITYQTALESKEEFSLEGIKYEAFNTSGGLGTLTSTLKGKVEQLNYKTVRYPGHRDLMKFLLKDLKFQQPEKRCDLVQLLDQSIPMTTQDMVLIMVTVTGIIKPLADENNGLNKYQQLTEVRRIVHQSIELPDQSATDYSAIQICTAASLCAVIELWMKNKLGRSGFICQESILLDQFYQTHYGKYLMP
ncbi:MAG: saccharopine dehydrogenase family protein [Oleispira sp.]|nr:saccharopine dehydrogenase family protein [Oleispira sp.]